MNCFVVALLHSCLALKSRLCVKDANKVGFRFQDAIKVRFELQDVFKGRRRFKIVLAFAMRVLGDNW